ncbi:hypothetical protein ACLBWS_10930 [Brucellaceae bacterium D45D]
MNYVNRLMEHRYKILVAKEEYAAAVQNLGSYIAHVGTMADPILTTSPDGYPECLKVLRGARVEAGLWSQGPSSLLISVPRNITDGLTKSLKSLDDADKIINASLSKPGGPDVDDLRTVISIFGSISSDISTINTSIEALYASIKGYFPDLEQIGKDLDLAVADINSMNSVDHKAISDIQDQIATLKSDISELAAQLASALVVAVSSGSLGAAAFLLETTSLSLVGWGLVGFCMVVVGFELTSVGLDAKKIVSDQQQINTLLSHCDELTADVSQLNVLADTVKGFIGQSADALNNLKIINDEWGSLSDTINSFLEDVEKLLSISNPGDMSYIAKKCETLQVVLREIIDDDKKLTINEPTISDGNFMVGDSDSVVDFKKRMSNVTNVQQYIFNKNSKNTLVLNN